MKNNRRNTLAALICVSVLIIAIGAITIASSGLASAKYKTQQVVNNVPVTITVTADLADTLEIKEHVANRLDSGAYELTAAETNSNSYVLMPGVDIPKDPFVRVTGKTEIPAYLYIEVIDSVGGSNSTYNYAIDSTNWTAVSGVNGKYGGTVYVYNSVLQKTATESGDVTVHILQNDIVTVKPEIDRSADYSDAGIQFCAYMVQVADGKTVAELFRTQIAS